HDRGVEVKGRATQGEGAIFLDRRGIRVDPVRMRYREAATARRTGLPEPDGHAEGRLSDLGALALETPVKSFEEAVRRQGWYGAGARLLRRWWHGRINHDVVKPQEVGADMGRIVPLGHPDDAAARCRAGHRGVGALVQDNGRRERADIQLGPVEGAGAEAQPSVHPVLREEDHG